MSGYFARLFFYEKNIFDMFLFERFRNFVRQKKGRVIAPCFKRDNRLTSDVAFFRQVFLCHPDLFSQFGDFCIHNR